MKHKKEILIIFGLLDVLLLGRFIICISFTDMWVYGWFPYLINTGRTIFLISLAFSGIGLVYQKKWSFILSYIQFPCRFLFMLLSFGFLSLLIPKVPQMHYVQPSIIIAGILEIIRLIVTIKIHIKENKIASPNSDTAVAKSE